MSVLHPALDAALTADRVTIFGAVQLDLPGHTVRLLDGSGVVALASGVFEGEDPVFGTLDGIDDFSDGAGDEMPGMLLSLLPPNDVGTTTLANAAMQGARTRVWIGARDDATGLAIGEPYLLFDGEVDVPTPVLDKGSIRIEYDCVGGMERYFAADEGIRLAPATHKRIWPGELGTDFVTGVRDPVYWGMSQPSGVRT